MRIKFYSLGLLLLCGAFAAIPAMAQTPTAARPTPTPVAKPATTNNPANAARPAQDALDLTQYGVEFEVDPRVIVMMAALDAAGFDATIDPNNPNVRRRPPEFLLRVRVDLKDLDPDLKARLRKFFELNNREYLKATPAEQAARYVSLAYALSAPPALEAPPRTDDLPGELLEVLDFAPLVREFYNKSGIEQKLPDYRRAYQGEGDKLRRGVTLMVASVISYLHTQPLTTNIERVAVTRPNPANRGKTKIKAFETREHTRRFVIVPDLLAVPGAINFRNIADDYYLIVAPDVNPLSSEMRRAYLQYVIDPLIARFNKDVTLRREDLKQLLVAQTAAGGSVSPDVYLAVSRSLVAAAEVRINEIGRVNVIVAQLNATTDKEIEKRKELLKQLKDAQTNLSDESVLQLSEAVARGSVLAFYFAEQLRGLENSGFDVASLIPDALSSFQVIRESARLTDNAPVIARAREARITRLAAAREARAEITVTDTRRATLVTELSAVEKLWQQKAYAEAEERLRKVLADYPREPRVFFALATTSSLSAQDAFDEDVQRERLQRALTNYQLAVQNASGENDKSLLSRAYVAMGDIFAHFEMRAEALQQYDAAIQLGEADKAAYKRAVQGKARLAQPNE